MPLYKPPLSLSLSFSLSLRKVLVLASPARFLHYLSPSALPVQGETSTLEGVGGMWRCGCGERWGGEQGGRGSNPSSPLSRFFKWMEQRGCVEMGWESERKRGRERKRDRERWRESWVSLGSGEEWILPGFNCCGVLMKYSGHCEGHTICSLSLSFFLFLSHITEWIWTQLIRTEGEKNKKERNGFQLIPFQQLWSWMCSFSLLLWSFLASWLWLSGGRETSILSWFWPVSVPAQVATTVQIENGRLLFLGWITGTELHVTSLGCLGWRIPLKCDIALTVVSSLLPLFQCLRRASVEIKPHN